MQPGIDTLVTAREFTDVVLVGEPDRPRQRRPFYSQGDGSWRSFLSAAVGAGGDAMVAM
jgi:hypothetical protein